MTPELKTCCLDKIETLSVSIWHIEDKQPFVFCGLYTDQKFDQQRLMCICSEIGARKIVLAYHLLIQLRLTFHAIHIRRNNYAH